MSEPRASRPAHPAGYWAPRPLPWSWAERRLLAARNYWIASVTHGGVPHSRPVWGAWLDGAFIFDTGSRIGTNLEANSAVTVHLESDEVVILEGAAERVHDAPSLAAFLAAYNAKYSGDLVTPPGTVFRVRPSVAYGWLCDPTNAHRGAIFGSTGTRWDFA